MGSPVGLGRFFAAVFEGGDGKSVFFAWFFVVKLW
jgi:hypothetical protein